MRTFAASCLVLASLAAWPRASATDAKAGERFYRFGAGANGTGVDAVVQDDLRVTSTMMACANCHRRSGWGTVEGPVTTPPVVGPVLFRPVTLGNAQMGVRSTGPGTRAAYDERTLLRAIREGIDPGGRRLSATMPRYDLPSADAEALVSYLKGLGSVPAPGVTDTTIHLATIDGPSADPARHATMLAVLRAFVHAKNAGTRNESRRREHGPWDMKPQYESYRRWELHEWKLTGSPERWGDQLASHYARLPVFALVSGAADGNWGPVHDFCEQAAIPCVFPQTPHPPIRGIADGFYSLYFSRGVALEAGAVASHLAQVAQGATRQDILQVVRCGTPAVDVARELEARTPRRHIARTRCEPGDTPLSADQWRTLLAGDPDVVVAWLGAQDLAGLEFLAGRPGRLGSLTRLYVSSSLLGDRAASLGPHLRRLALLAEPLVAPDELERHASRSLVWLKGRGLGGERHLDTALNTLFAVAMVADALATPRALGSREFFIEQIEHMVGRSPMPSAYPSLSIGTNRRFASLGCSVLKVPAEPGAPYAKVVPWVVPEVSGQEDR